MSGEEKSQRMSRVSGKRSPLRLGALYPDDMWVDRDVEMVLSDFRHFLPKGVTLVSAATPVPAVSLTLEVGIALAENGDIEEAAGRLLRYEPTLFAYYCTTVSFARGPGKDLEISRRITETTGKPATTTSTAMIEALKALNVSRVSLASPYLPDVEEKFVEFVEAHGIRVSKSLSLGLGQGHSIVPSEKIFQLAATADDPGAEAVFVGCTGQRLALWIETLERKLGKPVLTANQVTSWHSLRLMRVAAKREGRGRLFSQGW